MIPKLIFFDLDGTLINKSGEISKSVQEAIKKIKSLGTKIAFATGRPLFAATELMKLVDVDAPSAFCSSAVIYDPILKNVTHQWSVDPILGLKFLNDIQKAGLYVELHTIENYFIEEWTELTDIHLHYIQKKPIVTSFEKLITEQPIIKICIMTYKGEQEKIARKLLEQYPDFHVGIATGATHNEIIFLNATNPDASREVVFNIIKNDLGINTSEIMAFGDGESDKVFISMAGIGVAMGNAPESVKSAANFITTSVEEDGVLHALRTLVFENIVS